MPGAEKECASPPSPQVDYAHARRSALLLPSLAASPACAEFLSSVSLASPLIDALPDRVHPPHTFSRHSALPTLPPPRRPVPPSSRKERWPHLFLSFPRGTFFFSFRALCRCEGGDGSGEEGRAATAIAVSRRWRCRSALHPHNTHTRLLFITFFFFVFICPLAWSVDRGADCNSRRNGGSGAATSWSGVEVRGAAGKVGSRPSSSPLPGPPPSGDTIGGATVPTSRTELGFVAGKTKRTLTNSKKKKKEETGGRVGLSEKKSEDKKPKHGRERGQTLKKQNTRLWNPPPPFSFPP